MSAIAHDNYPPSRGLGELLRTRTSRRLLIAAAGCAVMALSGSQLASYLNTSAVTTADAATLN